MHKIVYISKEDEGMSSSESGGSGSRSAKSGSSSSTAVGPGNVSESWNMEICKDGAGCKVGGSECNISNSSSTNSTRTQQKTSPTQAKVGLSSIFAILIPIIFPLLHIVIFSQLWGNLTNPVDPKTCTCSCWDTVFKGPYESGIAGFKHVYFNGSWNTLKMWIITVMGVVFMYECFKQIFILTFLRKLRLSMVILFLSSLHSHYYAWWAHWNYWNDDFYDLWYHQVFFTLSELVSSVFVILYLDKRKPMHPLPVIIIANISLFHILSSGWDQFFFTVIQQKGHLHQVLRDIVLMTTDLIHAGISVYELRKYAQKKGQTILTVLAQRNHIGSILCTTLIMYFSVLLFP